MATILAQLQRCLQINVSRARMNCFPARNNLAPIALLFAISFLLSACTPMREPVNIAGNQWLGYHPLYLAYAEGCTQCPFNNEYYGEKPIKVNMLSDTTLVSRLFANGQLDGALITLDEAIRLQSNNRIDLCVARVLSFSQGADAVMLAPGVSVDDRPLRVGYEETALGGFLLHRAMQFLQLTENDLRPQMLLPNEHVQRVAEGAIDMIITYEPFISQLKSQGANVVFDSSQIPHEVLDLFVVRTSVWREHSDLLDWVAKDFWEKGQEKLLAQTPADAAFIQEALALNNEELISALAGLHFPDYEENRQILALEFDAISARLNAYLLNSGLISRVAHLPSCYDI